MTNHILLQKVKLTSTASSVTFSNIPQTGYTDLKVVASTRNTAANTLGLLPIRFNSSSSDLSSKVLYGFGNNNGTSSYTASYAIWGYTNGGTSTSDVFANTEFYISNYTSNSYKSVSVDGVNENNATDARQSLTGGLWSNTAAITSITLDALDGGAGSVNFVAGSTFSLYGVAATGASPATAPKADGGNIITTDGTYWYHTFTSSGFFTPISSLTCDYLVVAGGGGGGVGSGGGGGAGGYRTSIGASSLSVTAQAYTIAVGAGGAGGTSSNWIGSNGTTSTFSTINASGGGGGGRNINSAAGTAGGSGGGGGFATGAGGAGNTGGYTPVEGYAGGASGGAMGSGGGGGANAVGTTSTVQNGASGGAGKSNSISGTSTNYAGGGGGGAFNNFNAVNGTGGSGGTGGGGAGGNAPTSGNGTAGTAGTINTGGGGGGGGAAGSGGSDGVGGLGGSGIVIIRYAV